MEATTVSKLGPPKHVRFSPRGNTRIEKLSQMMTSLYPAMCGQCGKRFPVFCSECGHRAIRNKNGQYECTHCDSVSDDAECPAACDICDGKIYERDVSDSEQIRHSVNFLYTVMLAGYDIGDILMEITAMCRSKLQIPLKHVMDGVNVDDATVYMILYESSKEVDSLHDVGLGDLMTRLYDKAKKEEE